MSETFKVGDRVKHCIWGDGVVSKLSSSGWVFVDFDKGPNKTVCNPSNLTLINTLVEKTPTQKLPDTAFWLVWTKPAHGDRRSNRTPRVTYTNADDAQTAAETLAKQFPSRKFFVMKAESSYKASGVQKTVLT